MFRSEARWPKSASLALDAILKTRRQGVREANKEVLGGAQECDRAVTPKDAPQSLIC